MAGVSLCTIGNAGTLLTYGLGVVLEWRQLAGVLACLALPYIIGLLTCVPNDDNVMIGESSNTFGNSFVSKDLTIYIICDVKNTPDTLFGFYAPLQ